MLLIIFEGVDGSGKSTQLQKTREKLQSLGKSVFATRELGGTPLAEKLRALLHQKELDRQEDFLRDLLLVLASRRDHVQKLSLQKEEYLLCDRFLDSTLVYQGAGEEKSCAFIQKSHEQFVPSLPRETVILTFVFESQERLKERLTVKKQSSDRFDCRPLDQLWKTNALYKQQDWLNRFWPYSPHPRRLLLKAEASTEQIQKKILEELL